MPKTSLVRALAAACALLVGAFSALAQPVTGSVRGAEALHVRRGPSTDTPAFAVLARGSSVVVEEQSGQWVRVVLASGERGWVHVAFLDLPPGVPAAAVTPEGAAADPGALPVDDAPVDPGAVPPGDGSAPTVDAELAALRERLASLEAAVPPTSAAPAAPPSDPAGAVPPPLPVLPTVAVIASPDVLDVGPALAFGGVCLVVGFLLGTFYGQRQERRSRARVRF